MTTLLVEVDAHLTKLGLPLEWTTYDVDAEKDIWSQDGIMFLRRNKEITMCVLDTAFTTKNFNRRKGPLALEVFQYRSVMRGPSAKWVHLLDADTPEDMANAAFNYIVTGAYREV